MTSQGNTINFPVNAQTWKAPRTEVNLNQFWEEGTVLVKILRRFGCPLCRYEAKQISDLKPEFDRLGVKLVAIGFDEIGLQEWVDSNVWLGDLYMDPERKVYKQFDLQSFSTSKTLLEAVSADNRKAYKIAKQSGVGGNINKGDGKQLGATYVIGKGGKILYEYRQITFGTYPDLKKIVEVCGGNPDLVKDDESAPACNVQSKM